MESAAASHESMYGEVRCYWANRDGRLTVNLTVPFGCSGTLYLPSKYFDALTESGVKPRDMLPCTVVGNEAGFELCGGEYSFTA